MACLYDANVWVALSFAAHPHHGIASQHFQLRDSAQLAAFAAFAIGHDVELVTIDRDFKNFEKAGFKLHLLAP